MTDMKRCGWVVWNKLDRSLETTTAMDTEQEAIDFFNGVIEYAGMGELEFTDRDELITIPVYYNPEDIA